MKSFKLISLIVISSVFMAVKCEKEDNNLIIIKNNSFSDIYYSVAFYYPDTLLKESEYPPTGNRIKINEDGKYTQTDDYFEFNNTLLFFILDANKVDNLPWDSILENQTILKRYEVTEQFLDNNNWTIIYP